MIFMKNQVCSYSFRLVNSNLIMNLGETLPSTDNLSSSKTEQNGAVSTEDTHSTNVHIPKETYPLSTNEEFLEKNVT